MKQNPESRYWQLQNTRSIERSAPSPRAGSTAEEVYGWRRNLVSSIQHEAAADEVSKPRHRMDSSDEMEAGRRSRGGA